MRFPDQRPTADEAKVDYDVTVPAGIAVNVSTTSAPITADGLSGDIGLSSETRAGHCPQCVEVYVRVRSMTAAVNLDKRNPQQH